MTVVTSAVFDLIDALVTKFRADPTLTDPAYAVGVIDGPPLTDLSANNILFVGAQPTADQAGTGISSATFSQDWGELGARRRDEDLTVACELVVRDGNSDMVTLRQVAHTLLSAVETALRTDFTLSIGQLMWCHIVSAEVKQGQTTRGATISVSFVIAGRAVLRSI